MAAPSVLLKICETPGCGTEAKLQCPTCLKLGISGSFFCSQSCFKGNWGEHKKLHKKSKSENSDPNSFNPWPGFHFTGTLRPAHVTAIREVPDHIPRPDYAENAEVSQFSMCPATFCSLRLLLIHHKEPNNIPSTELLMRLCNSLPAVKGVPISERQIRGTTSIKVLDDEEQEGMRVACLLGREVLDIAAGMIKEGVTTEEIDKAVHEACIDRECYPSPLGYYQFPKSCCTSVNEVICHGIPDQRPLEDGDIVNIDISVYHKSFHGDLNETFFVGNVDEKSKKLVKTTYECLALAISEVKPGVRYREMGNIIQKHAQSNGFSVVRSYCGHGIHQIFHLYDGGQHYGGRKPDRARLKSTTICRLLAHLPTYSMFIENKAIGIMKPGHCFTIEPMISEGTWRDETWPDNWTAVTQDGKRSAQFEHTLLVTDTGCEVLTRRRENEGKPHFLDQM